jgi:hypothetical protein
VTSVAAEEERYAGAQDWGVFVRMVLGMGLARRVRLGLGHRPYRLAIRTPVLYSRNQSRTNIALSKENG